VEHFRRALRGLLRHPAYFPAASDVWTGEANYQKLLQIKQKYDPDGMFTCHHCVGSELRSADGNCKLQSMGTAS
jgi:hypothetical protein